MTSTELVSTPLDKEGNVRRRLGRLVALVMVALIGVGCSNAPVETGSCSSSGNTARKQWWQHRRLLTYQWTMIDTTPSQALAANA